MFSLSCLQITVNMLQPVLELHEETKEREETNKVQFVMPGEMPSKL